MKKLVEFIISGISFAFPGEVLNQILSKHNIHAFMNTMFSYIFLLFTGFFAGNVINRIVKDKSRAAIIYYLLFGTFGLMIEWFLLGNAPILDLFQIIVQPGMFTFWGTLLLGPRILMESSDFYALKKSFFRYFAGFSLLYLLIAIVVPKESGGIFFGFILFAAGTALLNLFYYKYFRQLACVPEQPNNCPVK